MEHLQQCPAFANAVVREDEADTRLPSHAAQESQLASLDGRTADPHGNSASSAGDAVQLAGGPEQLLQDILDILALGRLPKQVRGE